MPEPTEDTRARLLETIQARRAGIDSYVQEKTPASTRLSTISIVSSALAAALTAGPALGGEPFAQTVQTGLGLGGPDAVWRSLCFGALAVSVTAAISANLSKANDLMSRIAAAEAAGGLLEKMQRRLEYGELTVEQAVREYGDVVAGIPFVPEARLDPTSGESSGRGPRRAAWASPLVVVVTVLAVLLLVAALAGYVIGLARSAGDGTGAATSQGTTASTPPASLTSTPPSTTAPARKADVFAARVEGDAASLAIVVDDEKAAAYLCDGDQIEAWLEGPVVGDQLHLNGGSAATLTGSVTDGAISGQITSPALSTTFVASEGRAPAGVYQASIQVNGVQTRVRWAVQSDGAQVGIANTGGVRTPAPPLDLDDLGFMLDGAEHRAERV